jgi:hypothetical protein
MCIVTIRFYARSQNCEKRLLASSCANMAASNERIFMKSGISVLLDNLWRKFKFLRNLKRTTRTLHEDQYTFLTISRSILLRTRNVSDKRCRENQNTHYMFNNVFSKTRTIYEITWKSMVQPVSPEKILWRMGIACWITKATYTHSEHVILITFLLQQWLRKVPQRYVTRTLPVMYC